MAKKTNRTGIIVLGGLVGVGIWFFGKKSQAVENLEFNIKGVRFKKIRNITDILALRLKIILQILNPSNQTLGFKSFVGNVAMDNEVFGQFKIFEPVTLEPQSTNNLEIPVIINAITAFRKIVDLAKASGTSVNLRIRGLLKISNLEFPVDQVTSFTDQIIE